MRAGRLWSEAQLPEYGVDQVDREGNPCACRANLSYAAGRNLKHAGVRTWRHACGERSNLSAGWNQGDPGITNGARKRIPGVAYRARCVRQRVVVLQLN